MRDDLPGDLGQRSHRLAGDETGRPTSRDDGGDDAEAGAELHDFGAGGQVGLDLPDFLGFVGKGGQLAEYIPVGHQREGNFDAEKTRVSAATPGLVRGRGLANARRTRYASES